MTVPLPQTSLGVGPAVLLLHAWCSSRFRERRLRALFIKGPTLAAQGLRPARVSADVDVLAHPEDFGRVCGVLRENGWTARPEVFAGRYFEDHSVSFVHPDWPCDIDVHRVYPGFLADPAMVFERLWASRSPQEYAGVPCDACGRPANALMMGLHALRSRSSESRHQQELAHLIQHASFSDHELQEMANLAAATGSIESANPFLSHLNLPLSVEPRAPVDSSAIDEWRLRVMAADTHVWVWFNALRSTRGAGRCLVLWRAVWPSVEDLKVADAHLAETSLGRVRLRLTRMRRGLPSVVGLIRQARRLSRS